jgi:hypothetical protein
MKTPPPLPPELEALLAPHRAVLPLTSSVEARAIARAAAFVESPEPVAARVSGPPRWVFAAAAAAVLAMGAGAYAAAHGWIIAPAPRASARVAPIAPPRASEPRPPVVAVAPETEAPVLAPPAATHPKRNAAHVSATTVPTNAELQLLRAARQDVTRGDFAGALVVIAEHARSFRNGSLVEEREALRVKALAGLGRHEEAQRAAAAFHRRFPHSVLLSTFERMKEDER